MYIPQPAKSMPNGFLVPFQPKAAILSTLYALVLVADEDDEDYLPELIQETLKSIERATTSSMDPALEADDRAVHQRRVPYTISLPSP